MCTRLSAFHSTLEIIATVFSEALRYWLPWLMFYLSMTFSILDLGSTDPRHGICRIEAWFIEGFQWALVRDSWGCGYGYGGGHYSA
jgi:hypothetical protein